MGANGLPVPHQHLVLTDTGAVVVAAAVAAGAWWATPVPLWAGIAVALASLVAARWLRVPAVVAVGGLVLAAALADRSEAGLRVEPHGRFEGVVTLVGDPVEVPGGVEVEVRAGRRHLLLRAPAKQAGMVAPRLAGERLEVTGTLRGLGSSASYLHARHVVGRLSATSIGSVLPAALPWQLANAVHRWVVDGARWLPAAQRPLYTGFLLGDARGQSPAVASDMRAAGLGHLLVVSGENVAFLLVLLGPALRRIGVRWRWVAVLWLVAGFAVLTRFEPSVLRAVCMAGLGAIAVSLARPATGVRLLALSVTALVLVDPMLVHQLGFSLSVGATAGVCVLGPRLAAALPGPRLVARCAGTTIGAQVGVAPIAATAFGGLPVATLPANLLAAPAAAAVLVWGLPAGLVAALVRGRWAQLLQHPTGLLVGLVAGVARGSAALPLGELGGVALWMLFGLICLAVWLRPRGWHRVGRACLLVAAVITALPAWRVAHPPRRTQLQGGALWRDGGIVLVLDAGAPAMRLLDDLHRAGVRRLDLVVVPSGGLSTGSLVAALRSRWAVGRVLVPEGDGVRDGTFTAPGDRWRVGRLDVVVTADRPRLIVSIAGATEAKGPAAARGPPCSFAT